MIKYCPIMSFHQRDYNNEVRCMEDSCAFWDEENCQCCLKTQTLAIAGCMPYSFPLVSTSPAIVPNGTGDWNLQKQAEYVSNTIPEFVYV